MRVIAEKSDRIIVEERDRNLVLILVSVLILSIVSGTVASNNWLHWLQSEFAFKSRTFLQATGLLSKSEIET